MFVEGSFTALVVNDNYTFPQVPRGILTATILPESMISLKPLKRMFSGGGQKIFFNLGSENPPIIRVSSLVTMDLIFRSRTVRKSFPSRSILPQIRALCSDLDVETMLVSVCLVPVNSSLESQDRELIWNVFCLQITRSQGSTEASFDRLDKGAVGLIMFGTERRKEAMPI